MIVGAIAAVCIWGAGAALTWALSLGLSLPWKGAVGGAAVAAILGGFIGVSVTEGVFGILWLIPAAVLGAILGLGVGAIALWIGSWIGWLSGGAIIGFLSGAVLGALVSD